jgi:glycosyltransferase involved in cell wall biosynthesis
MEVEDAKAVVACALQIADVVIISIPLGYYPQDEYEGNPHEIHVTDNWTDAEVRNVFGEPRLSCIDMEIGVYIYSNVEIRKPKIAVYAISKNEEKFVERFCESCKDADYVVIADTGSTDNTANLARYYTKHIYTISTQPWRFDDARNASLALVPADADICICLDLDEVLEPGWRKALEDAWVPGTTRLSYKFDWGSGVVFFSDKIHSRNGYKWKHPCHELLYPLAGITEKWARTEFQLITHHPDNTKSRGSYLDLLKIGYQEDPTCTRNTFYYGRELIFRENWGEAIRVLNEFLKLDGWVVERAYAMRLLGKANKAMGNTTLAETWYLRAVAEDRSQREPLCDLAEFYSFSYQWDRCRFYALESLKIQDRQLLYTVDPDAWGYKPYDLLALSEYYLGNYKEAVEYGIRAAELSPQQRLKDNLNFYMGAIK